MVKIKEKEIEINLNLINIKLDYESGGVLHFWKDPKKNHLSIKMDDK